CIISCGFLLPRTSMNQQGSARSPEILYCLADRGRVRIAAISSKSRWGISPWWQSLHPISNRLCTTSGSHAVRSVTPNLLAVFEATKTKSVYPTHVWEGHPEQRTASLCHRRWHQRARQSRAQLSAPVERCAQPGTARHPPQSQNRRGVARPAPVGPDPVLVQ